MMNPRTTGRPDAETVAYWYTALKHPDLPPRILKRWEKWSAEPANRLAFDEAQRLWDLMGSLRRPAIPSAEALEADTYDGSVPLSEFVPPQESVKRPVRHPRSSWLAMAAVVGTVALGLGMIKLVLDAKAPSGIATFATNVAEHENVALSDGSHIQLGARTALTANLGPDLRLIVMDRGEALFEVAHDTIRPFRVLAGGGMITAVGTAFNVRRLEDMVVVTVTEGAVDVAPLTTGASRDSDSSRSRKVTRGEEIRFDGRGNLGVVRVADLDRATAWLNRKFTYSSEPLNQVVQDINRYSRRSVAISDSAAGAILYSGTMFERDIDDWLAALDKLFPEIQVRQIDAQHVVIQMRQQEPALKRDFSKEVL